ncbi:MAG: hypothetical protein JZD41_07850 [Thermoproteus sp.]|nr:hypothetical protein [Thermoproteus sp.]
MSVDVKIKKIAEKNEEVEKSMEQAVEMRIRAVAEVVKRGLGLSTPDVDPKVAAWLTARIAELITVLQHAPPQFSTKVLLTIVDALPDDVAVGLVKHYMDRIDRAYKTISQLASKLAPKTLGMGGRDPMTQIIYMLAEQYIAQQLGGGSQQPQREDVSPAPIPEELKRVIDQLNAAEDKGTNN